MNGAFLRRRDQTVRSLRVEHYSSAVNTKRRARKPAAAGKKRAAASRSGAKSKAPAG